VQNLVQNIRNIEQLYSQMNEKDRIKLDRQIRLLRTESDREMSEFHMLRDRAMAISIDENFSSSNDNINTNESPEDDTASNELRQRHLTTSNRLNDSYDLLEQDLILLRDTITEVAQLVKQQEEKISRTEQLTHMAYDRIRDASSLLQRAVHNKYISVASGALLGASLGGPIGCIMGLKIGALVALSGSAVGALSANIMQQRVTRNEDFQNRRDSYNQAML
jgi:syntaxin 17